jgi:hypothetical protein
MYDIKYQHFMNILNAYNIYGYVSLNSYDKYHVVYMIISIVSCDFQISLGSLLKFIKFSKFTNNYKVVGLTDNKFVVPSLFDMSMLVVKRNTLYSSNNYFNKMIITTPESSSIYDEGILVMEYFMKIFKDKPKKLIRCLIKRYRSHQLVLREQVIIEEGEEEEEYSE